MFAIKTNFYIFFLASIVFFSLFQICHSTGLQSKKLSTSDACNHFYHSSEKLKKLPPHLLKAISLKETGRWNSKTKESFAWPWTVTSGAWSHYFTSKENAIRAVKRLQLRNIKNIDVGCMQINLKYHPNAFKSLEEAFDPETNIAYAANFLSNLYKKHKSWHRSIEYYHSSNPKFNIKYRDKVKTIWKRVRSDAASKKRKEVKKAYLLRRSKNKKIEKNG
tara:strand:+ start:177 stop:836 length:660 start_codon:yes stop_codon:yes gene_type:complete